MTPQQLKAMKLALEALEIEEAQTHYPSQFLLRAITAIKEALAEHAMSEVQRLGQEIEQEPVAWQSTDSIGERYLCFDKPLDNDPVQPLYTTPPQRKPLTDDLYNELLFAVGNKCPNETRHQTALRYILQAEKGDEKAAHGIKGDA